MLKMVDGTGIIGVDMVCPLGGAVSPPQPPNFDKVEVEGVGSLMLPNSLKAPIERLELIGNSTQGENPAPDNPQEIKSAGRKSKNLLIENISVFTVQDNIAYIPLPEGHETKLYTMLIQKKPGENDDVGFTCGFYDKSNMTATYSAPCLQAGNLVTGNGIVNSKIGVNHFVCFSPADSRFFDIYNVMYAEGKETTLDYEPYGYLLDVKVTGKNLFSNKPTDWMIGKGLSWSTYPNDPISIYRVINSAVNVINLKPSTTYSIVNNSEKIVISRMIERNLSENGIKDHDVRSSKYTFATNQNTMNAILQIKKVDGTELLSSDIESIKIMLVEGEVNDPTPYEPYTEQTLTLTSDRPITKWDKLVEQGGQYGWLYQSASNTDVKPSRLDLFPNGFSLFKDFGNGVYVYKVTNIKKAIGFQTSLCEQFKNKDGSYSTGDLFCYSDQPSMQMQYFVTDIPTLEEFKTWMEANPLTMVYKTTQTVFLPLSQEEQTQLRNLHSYNGTTNITVDSGEVPCGIKLTYRKEK